jgi:hypothetical protein
MGPHGTLYQGATLAALDTGDPAEVYARHGSRDWMADLAAIVAAGLGFGLWAWLVPYQTAAAGHAATSWATGRYRLISDRGPGVRRARQVPSCAEALLASAGSSVTLASTPSPACQATKAKCC